MVAANAQGGYFEDRGGSQLRAQGGSLLRAQFQLNAGVLNLFLEQLSGALPAGVHTVLIWDGAGYYTSKDLKVPSNISLILLPPYSPELNPVENLWHYLRAHHWSNRAYQDYDELESEAAESLCTVCLDRDKVKSICNAEYVRKRA